MTPDELIKKFSEELKKSKDKKAKLEEIQKRIDNLIYSDSRLPVTNEYKLKIWEGIEKEVRSAPRQFSVIDSAYSETQFIIHEATDNSEILKLMGQIEGKLKGKIKG